MILNKSAIVAAHSPLIVNGNLGDAYRAGTFGCRRLIERIALAHDAMLHKGKDFRIEPVIVVELAVRCLNSCGAAGLLALSGYWSPAQHHLRDLVETTQLFELFRRDPSEAARWAEAFGITRYQKFGFNQVQAKLRGDPGQFDLDAFKGEFGNWSNRGSHPSMKDWRRISHRRPRKSLAHQQARIDSALSPPICLRAWGGRRCFSWRHWTPPFRTRRLSRKNFATIWRSCRARGNC